jgi:hypothetical protein
MAGIAAAATAAANRRKFRSGYIGHLPFTRVVRPGPAGTLSFPRMKPRRIPIIGDFGSGAQGEAPFWFEGGVLEQPCE